MIKGDAARQPYAHQFRPRPRRSGVRVADRPTAHRPMATGMRQRPEPGATQKGSPVHGALRRAADRRSEEHTSELQSRVDLVCRLLLAPRAPTLCALPLHDALPIWAMQPVSHTLINSVRAPVDRVFALLTDPQRIAQWLPGCDSVQSQGPLKKGARFTARFGARQTEDRKSTRLNSSHEWISYAVFCLPPAHRLSALFPYTTLFRSGRCSPSAIRSSIPSAPPSIGCSRC